MPLLNTEQMEAFKQRLQEQSQEQTPSAEVSNQGQQAKDRKSTRLNSSH